ncbi:pyridoxamine 5'-phosphate oxidase family protein [bacterium]|nr:pyridoxamine 5'-phosphate oxidase family protein [bacterium]
MHAIRRLQNAQQLRTILGHPSPQVQAKLSDRLNPLTRQFIERSPFVCLATCDGQGRCDVSPRGDAAGFVRILDERTLLIPERPGNRLADSLLNILENPHVGLLFLVPGIEDTFRVNGKAFLTDEADWLADSAVQGKAPHLAIVVSIEEAYTQCGKAFIRSQLWDPGQFQQRASLPSNGEIIRALQGPDFDVLAYDEERRARYARRENFY